jgi:hypothetical protein
MALLMVGALAFGGFYLLVSSFWPAFVLLVIADREATNIIPTASK